MNDSGELRALISKSAEDITEAELTPIEEPDQLVNGTELMGAEKGLILVSENVLPLRGHAEVLVSSDSSAPSHQRPDGVLGEWRNKPKNEWNLHQRVAEATNGWGTLANAVSLAGAVVSLKGLYDFVKGRRTKGITEIGIGRIFDLADGIVAAKTGTRGEVGAFVDSALDKALTLLTTAVLTHCKTLPAKFAAETAADQISIVYLNKQIHEMGGEVNPSQSGKLGMGYVWGSAGMYATNQALGESGHELSAFVAKRVARHAEKKAGKYGKLALGDYRKQLQSLRQAQPTAE